jgi:4-amino-4-deoxy-L-arabinose transferase-like glycosyltransferase
MNREDGDSPSTKLLDALVVVVALSFLGTFLYVTLRRIGYPFELEWMEGGTLDHVRRILGGEKIYVAPSIHFVPFIYTPLYFYVSAALSAIVGTGFLAPRLVSFIAALGCLAVIFLHARRLAGCWRPALASACFFAASYQLSGAWLDLARVDSLFLFFLLLAVHVQEAPATRRSFLLAGVWLSLAILTKQTALVVGVGLLAHAAFFHLSLAPWLVVSSLGIVGISTLILDSIHDGWYVYYLLLPWKDVGTKGSLGSFVVADILKPLPIATVLVVSYLYRRRRSVPRAQNAFHAMLLLAAALGCLVSRLRSGGYANVLLPFHAVLSMLVGPAVWDLAARARTPRTRRTLALLTRSALIVQFALLAYRPSPLIPPPGDVTAGEGIVRTLAGIDGDVLVPFHAYLADRAGKGGFASGNAGGDVLRADEASIGRALADETRQAIRSRRFGAIVLDESESPLVYWTQFGPLFRSDILENYVARSRLLEGKDAFWTRSGAKTRPQLLLVPRKDVVP